MPDLDPLESVAASELVSASVLAALIPALVNRGVLSPQDAKRPDDDRNATGRRSRRAMRLRSRAGMENPGRMARK
jgi:hypothetical protein